MPNIYEYCQACGKNWRDHLGTTGTCAKCMAWETMAHDLAKALAENAEEAKRDRVLGEYEKLKFLNTR